MRPNKRQKNTTYNIDRIFVSENRETDVNTNIIVWQIIWSFELNPNEAETGKTWACNKARHKSGRQINDLRTARNSA